MCAVLRIQKHTYRYVRLELWKLLQHHLLHNQTQPNPGFLALPEQQA
jgi:hypothetical protein